MSGESRRRSRKKLGKAGADARNKEIYRKQEAYSSREGIGQMQGRGRKKKGGKIAFFLGLLCTVFAFGAGVTCGWMRWGRETGSKVDLAKIEIPDWITQDFIRENIYSRPATSRYIIRDIVVHYVANPGKTAAQNRTGWQTRSRERRRRVQVRILLSDWMGKLSSVFPCVNLPIPPITAI